MDKPFFIFFLLFCKKTEKVRKKFFFLIIFTHHSAWHPESCSEAKLCYEYGKVWNYRLTFKLYFISLLAHFRSTAGLIMFKKTASISHTKFRWSNLSKESQDQLKRVCYLGCWLTGRWLSKFLHTAGNLIKQQPFSRNAKARCS